jgi:hypothetical protein
MRSPVVSASYQSYQNDAVSIRWKGYTSNIVLSKPTTHKNWKYKYDITYMTLHPVPSRFSSLFSIQKIGLGGFYLFLQFKNRVYMYNVESWGREAGRTWLWIVWDWKSGEGYREWEGRRVERGVGSWRGRCMESGEVVESGGEEGCKEGRQGKGMFGTLEMGCSE